MLRVLDISLYEGKATPFETFLSSQRDFAFPVYASILTEHH